LPTCKENSPDRDGGPEIGTRGDIRILEEIIRDPETNATARCTAIRTLREIPEPPAVDESLYDGDNALRMTGRERHANQRLTAEQ
jgi:hypothetical protein